MNKTQIEWVKNPDGTQGYTWNPITGCLNGCPYCYARKLANGRLKQRYLANLNIAYEDLCPDPDLGGLHSLRHSKDPFYPRFWEDRLADIKRGYHYTDRYGGCEFGAKAKGIFVCDMGELFGDWIPREWQTKVFKAINTWDNRNDLFYLLTKQPQNLPKFSPFPDNCWVGITATNREAFITAVNNCQSFEAPIKFVSFEPLLNEIGSDAMQYINAFQWVIIGAQTKPYKPPKIEWVEEIIRACDKAGIPVFLKDNLRPLLVDALAKKLINRKQFFTHSTGYGGDLRQEMPIE